VHDPRSEFEFGGDEFGPVEPARGELGLDGSSGNTACESPAERASG
jgi:hypothetical protein